MTPVQNPLDFWNVAPVAPPHDQNIWVEILVHIRHNPTGEIVEYIDHAIWDDEEEGAHVWIWDEGNFGSDGNRHLFFERAKGNWPDADDDLPSGYGMYSVRLFNAKNKQLIYIDNDWSKLGIANIKIG